DDATQVYRAVPSAYSDQDWSSEATQVHPAVSMPRDVPEDVTQAFLQVESESGLGSVGEPTVRREAVAPGVYRADDEPSGPRRKLRSGLGRAMMVTGAALGVLVLAYAADMVVSWGDVPRGVTVAGVDVGGMSRTEAEQKLRQELQPRFDQPVKVTEVAVQSTLGLAVSGLGDDWQAGLGQAWQLPWYPFTRLTSFCEEREVGFVGKSDRPTPRKAVERLADDEINQRKR